MIDYRSDVLKVLSPLNSAENEKENNIMKEKPKTIEVVGNEFVTGIKYKQEGKEKTLDLNGVFVEI